MIYIKATREAYKDGIIKYITWIYRKFNLSDAMMKPIILAKVVKAVDECKLHYEVIQSYFLT